MCSPSFSWQGWLKERPRQFDEAIRESKAALKVDPALADAHNNLGSIYFLQGKLQEAITKYQDAVSSDANHLEAHYNLGLAHTRLGDLSKARGHYEQALRIQPDFRAAQNALSSLGEEILE